MVQITQTIFPFFFPFSFPPPKGVAGIAGISHSFLFRDISGIAGKAGKPVFISYYWNKACGQGP